MLSNYRCTKAPAPEKYQPCSLPVCDPGKCQNRCFQIVYEKNPQTIDIGLTAQPPCAWRQPGVRFDGGGGKPFNEGSTWEQPKGQNGEGGGRRALSLPRREGGWHGWIWVHACQTVGEWRSVGRKEEREGTGQEGSCVYLAAPMCLVLC